MAENAPRGMFLRTEKTTNLRHVWREISDGNRDVKVLALQQEVESVYSYAGREEREHLCWEDVEIDHRA